MNSVNMLITALMTIALLDELFLWIRYRQLRQGARRQQRGWSRCLRHKIMNICIVLYCRLDAIELPILLLEIISRRFGYRPKYQPETPLLTQEL